MYAGKCKFPIPMKCMLVNVSFLTDEMYAGKCKFPTR